MLTRSRGDVREAAGTAPDVPLNVALALTAAVLVVGTLIRLAPLATTAVWGSDTGEYVHLTDQLVERGAHLLAYDGWGIAYPYFPGMYALTGAVIATTGLPVLETVQAVTPVIAGLLPVGVLLLTHAATGSRLAAVTAGALVAVTAPSVVVTSHAMPGTLGHVLVVAGLLLVAHAYRDARHLVGFTLVAVALLVTHHLSTYFLVGVIAGTAFLRELGSARSDARALRVEVPAAAGLLALAAAWWLGVADVFRERIVADAFGAPPLLTAAAFVAALAALPALVALKRRAAPAFTWRPRAPGVARALAYGVGAFTAVIAGASAFIVLGFPGTNIHVTWTTVLYTLAPAVIVGLAAAGAGAVRVPRRGFLLWGWAAAITVSLVFAAATGNRVLFPYRHLDYLIEAWAALAGVGVVVAAAHVTRAKRPRVARRVGVAALAVLLVASAATAYPPREAVGGFEEGVTAAELEGVLWAAENLPPGSTFAADHRVSSLLFGLAGHRPSWDYTPVTYHAESAAEALAELAAVDIPSGAGTRLDYVFLSPVIRDGVILVQWENAAPMSDAAYRKFFEEDRYFEEVYGVNDVHVFRVRWENT